MDTFPERTKLEAAYQIIYPVVEIEPLEVTSPTKNATPEVTPVVPRSSQVKVKAKQDYIPSISGKQYET